MIHSKSTNRNRAYLLCLLIFIISVSCLTPIVQAATTKTAFDWNLEGNSLYNAGRLYESLNAYNNALSIDPSLGFVWTKKGVVLYYLGRYSEALAAYNKALSIDPNDATAQKWKVKLLNEMGTITTTYPTTITTTVPQTPTPSPTATYSRSGDSNFTLPIIIILGVLFLAGGGYGIYRIKKKPSVDRLPVKERVTAPISDTIQYRTENKKLDFDIDSIINFFSWKKCILLILIVAIILFLNQNLFKVFIENFGIGFIGTLFAIGLSFAIMVLAPGLFKLIGVIIFIGWFYYVFFGYYQTTGSMLKSISFIFGSIFAIGILVIIFLGNDMDFFKHRSTKAVNYFNQGTSESKSGDYESAIKHLDKAIAYNSKNKVEILFEKSQCYLNLKRYSEALQMLDDIINLNNDKTAWFKKAQIFQSLNKIDDAILSLDNAIKIDSNYLEALTYKGYLLIKQKKFEKSLRIWNNVIELNPNAEYYFIRGMIFSELGQHNNAIQDFNQSLSVSSYPNIRFFITLDKKGDSYLELKNYEQALQSFNTLLSYGVKSINEAFSKSYLETCIFYFDYEKNAKLFLTQVFKNKGFALEKLGENDDALQAYERAAVIDTTDKFNISEDLARVRVKMKDSERVTHVISGEKVHIGDNTVIIRDSVLTRPNISIDSGNMKEKPTCPECGEEIKKNEKYCIDCGARIR